MYLLSYDGKTRTYEELSDAMKAFKDKRLHKSTVWNIDENGQKWMVARKNDVESSEHTERLR